MLISLINLSTAGENSSLIIVEDGRKLSPKQRTSIVWTSRGFTDWLMRIFFLSKRLIFWAEGNIRGWYQVGMDVTKFRYGTVKEKNRKWVFLFVFEVSQYRKKLVRTWWLEHLNRLLLSRHYIVPLLWLGWLRPGLGCSGCCGLNHELLWNVILWHCGVCRWIVLRWS